MLFRVFFALLLVAGILALVRRFRGPRSLPARPEPRRLGAAELEELERAARGDARFGEALGIRRRIVEACRGVADFSPEIDEMLRQLAAQVELERRIDATIADLGSGRLDAEVEEAKERLAAIESPEARGLAERNLVRLEELRSSLALLESRREELDMIAQQLVLELRSAELAVLEAASSQCGREGSLDAIRSQLGASSEELRRMAAAEQEVGRLLRQASIRTERER